MLILLADMCMLILLSRYVGGGRAWCSDVVVSCSPVLGQCVMLYLI